MIRPARQRPRAARLLEPRHWQLLWLMGAANFFAGYDFNIVTVALPQLRASYHLSQSQASLWIAVIYLGAAPAVLLGRRADRSGRRRLLIFSISGYTLATLATAAAPSIGIFVGCQLAARFFLCTEGVLVWTMVAEELPAAVRGFGFGWLAMLSALGTGWSAILYGGILAPAGLSWRLLYLAAVPVLVVVAVLRRRIPESARFLAASGQGQLARRWSEILRPPHRRLLVLVCVTAVLVNLSAQAVVFVVDFMENERHLSATAADLILVVSGAAAIPVLILAGRAVTGTGASRCAVRSWCSASSDWCCSSCWPTVRSSWRSRWPWPTRVRSGPGPPAPRSAWSCSPPPCAPSAARRPAWPWS